jgi:DNA-directed RNA polymerase subunit beta
VGRRREEKWADDVSDGEALGRNQLAAANDNTRTANPPKRISFAKIREPLEVPDLLGLQTDSFDWLIGSEAWQDRVAEAIEIGDDSVATTSGLEDIFEEISPIEDFGGSMSLSFREHRFEAAQVLGR